jgi:hypothetical protein
MRSAHCEIRPGENVTLQYLSHDGRPAPPCEPSPPHLCQRQNPCRVLGLISLSCGVHLSCAVWTFFRGRQVFIFVVPTLEPESSNSVVPTPRCQEVVHDEISHVTSQSLTGREVE